MRLTDTVAARRALYRRPIPTLPDIVLLDVPQAHAGHTLPLGRFYPILVETEAEMSELTERLDADQTGLDAPTWLERRRSALTATRITMARYNPEHPDWPWILLCHWPADIVRLAPEPDQTFARGAYTIEIFASADQLTRSSAMLLAQLSHNDIEPVAMIVGGQTTTGTA